MIGVEFCGGVCEAGRVLSSPAFPLAWAPIERMWPRTVSGRSSAACRDFVELGGQSDKPPWQAGRDHVDLGCYIDLGAHSRRQLMDVGGSGFGHAAGVAHLRVSAGELIRAAVEAPAVGFEFEMSSCSPSASDDEPHDGCGFAATCMKCCSGCAVAGPAVRSWGS